MPNVDTSKKFDSVAIYRIKKLLSDLSNKTGRGTELVSLYLPSKKAIHEAIAALREESGTASNIKSDVTRNHVQDALTKTIARLRLYKQTPENGLVIFCGAIPGPGGPGNETIELFEVLPQKPVTTYLYRCLSPETMILLDDGSQRAIRELRGPLENGVTSLNHDSSKFESAPVARFIETVAGERKTFCLKVESGRSIVATEDHPFFTPRGWITAGNLKLGDLTALKPISGPIGIRKDTRDFVIVDESAIRQVECPPANIELTVRRLKQRGLLPLKSSNPKLYLLSRLLGHLFSDGSLTHNIEIRNGKQYSHYTLDFCVGNSSDYEEIKLDSRTLGVSLPKVFESTHVIKKDGRSYTIRSFHAKMRDTALLTLLRALGAPVGSKVKNCPPLPAWIGLAPEEVQREFLAAYMGGDGEVPRMYKSNPISAVRVTFHRIREKESLGLRFAEELQKIFSNFGVVVNQISTKNGYVRKNGSVTSEIELRFKLSQDNLLRMCSTIGYRYCKSKSIQAEYVGEYLRIKREASRQLQSKMITAKNMNMGGSSIAQISRVLEIPNTTAKQWALGLVSSPLIRSTVVPEFEDWLKLAKQDLAEDLLWETIVSIEEVEQERVMDLTIDNQSHSFVAGGFLVHNCDDHFHIEPLRDMLREQNVIGVLAMDSTDAGLGIVSGDSWEVIDTMSSGVSGKTRKGGQSARRYERLREMELTDYFNRLADHAKKSFLEQYEIKGLIVSGPGPTKDEFVKDKYLDYRLQNVIIGTLDTGYAGREGVRESIEKAGKLLEDVRVIEEKKLVQRFFREVNSDTGLAIYGVKDIIAALKKAAVDTIMINDDVDTLYLKATCNKCGNVEEKFVQRAQIVAEKQRLLTCSKCGSTEVEIVEKDIVDYLADLAIDSGANVEVISSKTEDGSMMKNFGGISAILRYRA